jgi:hypothetical protein
MFNFSSSAAFLSVMSSGGSCRLDAKALILLLIDSISASSTSLLTILSGLEKV